MLALRRGQQWLFHPWGLTPSPGREKTGRGGGVPLRTVKQGGEGASPEHGEDTWKSLPGGTEPRTGTRVRRAVLRGEWGPARCGAV